MNRAKQILVTSFASFSMFFGAGNLILPPLLGFKGGEDWLWMAIGFCISAVILPLLGIFAHAKLQGTVLDFTQKLPSPVGLLYCFGIYGVCLLLPAPRTASVAYELAVAPFCNLSPLLFSILYFFLALILVFNRSKVLDILGQYLTPIIIVTIIAIVGLSMWQPHPPIPVSAVSRPLLAGLFEGYQTFDAIAGIVVGGVIIVSLNMNEKLNRQEKKQIVRGSGILTGVALFLIYAGFIYTGALFKGQFPETVTRAELLSGISLKTLGNVGAWSLSVLVSLACFTTAVGIIAGAADFVKSQMKGSVAAYRITVVLGCLLGVLVGRFDVSYIMAIGVPVLMLIYPVTIVLVVFNLLPTRLATRKIFIGVVGVAFLFALPDFLITTNLIAAKDCVHLPLSSYNLGWLLPVFLTWLAICGYESWTEKRGIRDTLA